jgi:flagellar hook-associated protein 1 FlgK
MASLMSLLDTARDALSAQSYGLDVTGQNIANVNTPGYVRRAPILETQALGTSTTGSVKIGGLQRATDIYTERATYQANGSAAAANTRDQALSSVESLFNDTSGQGLADSLGKVFSSFSALSANPTDATTRANVLSAADAFSQRVNQTAASLTQTSNDLLHQGQETVTEINQRATDIAKLDTQIQQAQAQGQDAADLLDQRNAKLTDLSSLVDVHTFTDNQGNLVVQASGATIVNGGTASALSVGLAADGSMQILSNQPSPNSDVTQFLTGGSLAGIKQARDTDIAGVSKQLDQFAFDVASAINTQHAAGFGSDGGTGRNLFDVPATSTGAAAAISLSTAVAGHPEFVAAASSVATTPGGSDNAAALSGLEDAAIANGNSETASSAYGDLVGSVGELRAGSQRNVATQAAVQQQAQTMQQSLSGVSLDDEMVALTKYQNAYGAATKVLNTVDQMLSDLMSAVGR